MAGEAYRYPTECLSCKRSCRRGSSQFCGSETVGSSVLSCLPTLTFNSYRPREYETEDGPWDPISGGASALLGTIASLTMGIADLPIELFKFAKNKKSTLKEDLKQNSSSGNNSPPSGSRSQSSLDLGIDEMSSPTSYFSESASQQTSTAVTPPKNSYSGTERSSTETPTVDAPLTTTTSGGEPRVSSLKQALRGQLSRSRSTSRDRSSNSRSSSKDRRPGSRSGSRHREETPFDPSKLTIENVKRSGKGAQRIVAAGMKSPMDFTLGLARGFHNAPKLYGDDTVRPQERVTDLQSGLKAAGKVCIGLIRIGGLLTFIRNSGTAFTME